MNKTVICQRNVKGLTLECTKLSNALDIPALIAYYPLGHISCKVKKENKGTFYASESTR